MDTLAAAVSYNLWPFLSEEVRPMANWIYQFETQVHNRGRQIAIIHDGRAKTYDELNREASSFGNWVRTNGYQRVAVYMANAYEFYVVQFGTLKAGAMGIPINYMFAEEIIEYVLKDSDADVIVCFAADAKRAAGAATNTNVKAIVTLGESEHGTTTLAEILRNCPDTIESAPKSDDDLFNLMYTSGTTGRPKGVMKTHRNMGAHIDAMVHLWKLGPNTRMLCCGPIYHTSGLESSSLPVLAAGGTVISMKWNVDKWFEQVQRYKCDCSYIVGSMMVDIANYEHPEKWNFTSLQWVIGGGTPMNERAYQAIGKKYKFVLTERLGMTEAGIIFAYPVGKPGVYNPRDEIPYRISGSCGKPLYNEISFRLFHPETGTVTQTGEGELQLKGDSLFKGYWNQPEQTRKAFTEDGWFRTGDIIRITEDGHVFHRGRRDEILISGGENVSPRAIEIVLESHPEVLEAATFGLPHDRWGTEICAAVVKQPGTPLTEEQLIQYCKESGRLARFEVPKRIFFRDELPKTPTHSVPRRKLTQEYLDLAGIGKPSSSA